MTISRSRLVDATVSRWYHCIARCVRRAHLMGDEAAPERKDWIENRLEELDQIFAVSVGGRLLGRFLAATRDKLRELAAKLQVRHLANVG